MAKTEFTPEEFAAFASSLQDAQRKSMAYGYTNGGSAGAGCQFDSTPAGEVYSITIDQSDVCKNGKEYDKY